MSWIWLSACALHSGLSIEAGQSFQLGENRHGAFQAAIENEGTVPVELRAVDPSSVRTLGVLSPGASTVARFGAGEVASFVNDGDATAQLAVRVTGDKALSMGYAPLP